MSRSYWIFIVLYFNIHFLTADVSLSLLSYPFDMQGDSLHVSEKCADLLNTFAQSASNMTMCSIINARPVRLCESCVNQFVKFISDYNLLLETVDNGTSCKSIFISTDRLDAVIMFYDQIVSVWEKGNCENCFEWHGTIPNNTKEFQTPSNNTKKFNSMYNVTIYCIHDNLNKFGNNTDKVCDICLQLYEKLDEFYKTLSTDGIGVNSVCMDVVDLMNTTRSLWSKKLDCCKLRRAPEVVFLCCTSIIALLPVMFYLAVRYCGPIRDLPNVLRTSRFSSVTRFSSVRHS